jgi:SprT protein
MSNIIPPQLVPPDVKVFAESNVKKALDIGFSKLKVNIPFEGVKFFKKSRAAGYVVPSQNNVVYLNLELLKRNMEHFERDTIPHEVAHLLAHRLNNNPREGHHGKTWKTIMSNVFGVDPCRCHSLDTTGVGRKTKKFKYICACKKHLLSLQAHKKIENQSYIFRCRDCKKTLTFLSEL